MLFKMLKEKPSSSVGLDGGVGKQSRVTHVQQTDILRGKHHLWLSVSDQLTGVQVLATIV